MADKDKLSPEEQLLKLIEEPTGPRSESAPRGEAAGQPLSSLGATVITRQVEKAGLKSRLAAIFYVLRANLKIIFQGRSAFKTLNRILMGVMIISLAYLIYDVTGVSTAISYAAIPVAGLPSAKQVEVITPPDVELFLAAVNLRDIFAEIKPPELVVPPINNDTLVNPPPPPPHKPLPTSLDELAKTFTLRGVIRLTSGTSAATIEVNHPKMKKTYPLLKEKDKIEIENENQVTISQIEQDFIIITDGVNQKKLTIGEPPK